MREIAVTRQYKKDIERLQKQGKNMAKLNEVVKKLAADSNGILSSRFSTAMSVLAEELGPHYTSHGVGLPVEHFNLEQREHISLVEFKARKWAALKLMPRDRLMAALAPA